MHARATVPSDSAPKHAIALHVGFAGARKLFPDLGPETPASVAEARVQQIVERLKQSLEQLTESLGLPNGYFPVGLSQMAIGADSAFADAWHALEIPHRVILPQTRADHHWPSYRLVKDASDTYPRRA